MSNHHKNKTLATLLASTLGGTGAHRFYLQGFRDIWGWAHLLTIPVSLLAIQLNPDQQPFFLGMPFILSTLVAFIEALVIGLTPDEKWDATHNPATGKHSCSTWPLALLLVATVAIGSTCVIAVLARSLDLWLTGGAQG